MKEDENALAACIRSIVQEELSKQRQELSELHTKAMADIISDMGSVNYADFGIEDDMPGPELEQRTARVWASSRGLMVTIRFSGQSYTYPLK